jgi:mono/diheme cytochrome c family protein
MSAIRYRTPTSAPRSIAARPFRRALLAAAVVVVLPGAQTVSAQPTGSATGSRELLDRYCVTCHSDRLETAGLSLEQLDLGNVHEGAEVWEKVIRKLRTGTMPPSTRPQPPAGDRDALVSWLESSLDQAAAADPNPGRTETLRRLNRTEYQNAIRDLLALDVDARSLLPPDESGYGFDNVNVGDLSPALLDRYISAAQKVSRLAIGTTLTSLQSDVLRVPADTTQEEHVAGLPIGTRGGLASTYTFAQDGEYDILIRLARNRTGNIGGLRGGALHTVQLLVDRMPVATFTVERPEGGDDSFADSHLKVRVPVTAGPHTVGATFLKRASSLLETERQPLHSHFNEQRHPRLTPAIYQVTITGPHAPRGADDTPSRRQLFVCNPTEGSSSDEETACAREILTAVMRRAYRRPVSAADVEEPMAFYHDARSAPDAAGSAGSFDAGIGAALTSVLVNPEFLFRVELDPAEAGGPYRISDLELASRLSFFLWSSIPDDELLDVAIRGELSRPDTLEHQARRLLADPRSGNLASNFAGQWLLLRNLDAVSPNPRLYPDFDDNLRQAFRQETELFFDSVLREDRSVLDLLSADYTFLNERLARHYGIPGIHGSRFRRVALDENSKRGGLLRQGSILSVTSYATRTSPVIRGKWVLDNIYGAPPPPPPANVPTLEDNSVQAGLPMRERLSQHRNNPACASCHNTIDPVGFALENFDAVGRWRDHGGDIGAMDATGGLPGVGEFVGVDGLEAGLLSRPEQFGGRVAEKLLTFALGRGVEYYDAPAIRQILRDAEPDGYRFSSLILGIVKSLPFQMRNPT